MIKIECDQGSPDWHAARVGCITASMFSVARERVGGLDARQQQYVSAILGGATETEAKAIAGYKAVPTSEAVKRAIAGEKVGDFSGAAKDYAFRVACERVGGKALDDGGFETFAMRRGHELEPEARTAHEVSAGVVVERCGFVKTPDGVFGASADGLIGDHGGSEYKCLIDPSRIRSVLLESDISEFLDQIHGCMWLTGRRWWHFALYCPALESAGMALWWRRVDRDDEYIASLESGLMEFKGLVDDYEAQIRALRN